MWYVLLSVTELGNINNKERKKKMIMMMNETPQEQKSTIQDN